MIKSQKKKIYGILIVALLFISSFCILFGLNSISINTAEAQLTDVELLAEYKKGEKFNVPKAKMILNGKELDTTSELVFPSGKVISKNNVELNEVGNYVLRYRAHDNNKQYIENKTFNVYNELFSVSSDKSSAEFTNCDYFGESLKTEGIALKLFAGDVFTYNQVVDLRKLSSNESLVNVSVTPQKPGEKECNELLIMITDAYDKNNVVTVSTLAHPTSDTAGVMKAGAANQDLSGYESRKNKVHIKGQWGFPSFISFTGKATNQNPRNEASFMFDFESGAVRSKPRTGNSDIVAVLKDAFYFKNLWDGFTTGEVYISIKTLDNITPYVNLFINNIGGQNLGELRMTDNVKPDITVDTQGYDKNNLPCMVIDQPYDVYNAIARDAQSGYLDVDVSVYKNYNASKENISIDNGQVTVKTPGNYTIEYKATDYSGNESIELLYLKALKSAPKIDINLNKDNITLSEIIGNRFYIGDCEPNGGLGKIDVKVEVYNEKYHYDFKPGERIALSEAGSYTVKYTAIDRANTIATDEYTVTITTGDRPVFIDDPIIPKYFIDSYAYILPSHYAYNYTDGSKSPIQASIYVVDKKGKNEVKNNVCAPKVENSGDEVTIIYSAKLENGGTTEIQLKRPVYRVTDENNKIKIDKYFKVDNMDVYTPEGGNHIEFTAKENYASCEFMNALLADGFYTKFSLDTLPTAKAVKVTMTDYANEKMALQFVFSRSDKDNTYFNIVGDKNVYEIKSASFDDGRDYSLNFYNSSCRLVFDEESNTSVVVKNTMYGDEFTGFSSGKVYLKFEFLGERNSFKMNLKTLNEQSLGDIERILSKPRIGFYPISSDFNINTKVEIKSSAAADVFDSYVEFSMTVLKPDGTVCEDINGLLLEHVDPNKNYTISLKEYGNYNVQYFAKNSYGRSENDKGFIIRVVDSEAPTIEIKGSIVEKAVVGDNIFVPKATVKDNVDEDIVVRVYVKNPRSVISTLNLSSHDGFVAKLTGIYTIYYVCYDASGNMSMEQYQVIVSGEK